MNISPVRFFSIPAPGVAPSPTASAPLDTFTTTPIDAPAMETPLAPAGSPQMGLIQGSAPPDPSPSAPQVVPPTWTCEVGPLAERIPLVTDGNRVYLVDPEGMLHARASLDGAESWAAELPGKAIGPPVPFPGGVLISTEWIDDDGGPAARRNLCALSAASGAILWEKRVCSGNTQPVLAGNVVVVRDGHEVVTGLGLLDGKTRWHKQINSCQGMQAAAGEDGTAYIFDSGQVMAMNGANGDVLWRANVSHEPDDLVWRRDGLIVGASTEWSYVVGLDAHTGRELWHQNIPGVSLGSGASGPIPILRVRHGQPSDTGVAGLNPEDGGMAWNTPRAWPFSPPVTAPDGSVFVASSTEVLRLDSQGQVNAHTSGVIAVAGLSSPCVGPGGGVFVADALGRLRRFDFRIPQDVLQKGGHSPTPGGEVVKGDGEVVIGGVRIPVRKKA